MTLSEKYRKKYNELLNRLETEEEITPRRYEKKLLYLIAATLSTLSKSTGAWMDDHAEAEYSKAWASTAGEVTRQYKRAGLAPPSPVTPNPADVREVADAAKVDLYDALQYAGKITDKAVRDAINGALAHKQASNLTIREARENLIDTLRKQGIPAIRTANGRYLQLDSYADMVIRSETNRAVNTGVVKYAEAIGARYVRMSEHYNSCPLCAPYQGRVYSLYPDDHYYPYLYETPWSGTFQSFHPNCQHYFSVWIEEAHTQEEIDAMREYSGRSFDPGGEGWTKEQYKTFENSAKAYEAKQRRNAQIYNNKKQYKKYKAVLGDKMPKSFESFHLKKYNNSEWWSGAQTEYKAALQQNWQRDVLARNSQTGGFKTVHSESDIPRWADKQVEVWTDAQKDSLNYYTSHEYSKINEYLRGRVNAGDGVKEHISNISDAIDNSVAGENITVWRGARFSGFSNGELLKGLPVEKWPGRKIDDKAFSSTSMLESGAFENSEITMQVLVSKGKTGAFVKPISDFAHENEFLLQKGSVYKILEAEMRGGKYFIKAELE